MIRGQEHHMFAFANAFAAAIGQLGGKKGRNEEGNQRYRAQNSHNISMLTNALHYATANMPHSTHGDHALQILKNRKIFPRGAPASRRLRTASCRARVFAKEDSMDQQKLPFRARKFLRKFRWGQDCLVMRVLHESPALFAMKTWGEGWLR